MGFSNPLTGLDEDPFTSLDPEKDPFTSLEPVEDPFESFVFAGELLLFLVRDEMSTLVLTAELTMLGELLGFCEGGRRGPIILRGALEELLAAKPRRERARCTSEMGETF